MIVRPLIPQQSTVNGKRKVISRYENGGEAANTGIGNFSPTLDQVIAGATYDPQAFLDETRRIQGKGAVGTTVGLYGDMYELAKELFPGVPIDKILESLPNRGIAGLFKASQFLPTTKDVEDFAETKLGIDVPREDMRYKFGQYLPITTALGVPATMVSPQMLTSLGKYTDKIKNKVQEFFDNLGFGEKTLDTGIGVFVPGKIETDKKGSNLIYMIPEKPTQALGDVPDLPIDPNKSVKENIEKAKKVDVLEEYAKKGDTYLENEHVEMVASYATDPMVSFSKVRKYRDKAQADVNKVQNELINTAKEVESEKRRLYSKYQPQVKKYATLNPEVEQEILNTVLNGLEPIENLQPSTFKVKIYDPNTDSVKLLTKDSVDNTGKSLEDLQKNIIVPLLEDLQKLDNTVIKKVVPSINRTPPYEFNDNMNELQLDTNSLSYFLNDETKLLGKFVDTPNLIKSFGQPMLTQKILATRNELEEILGKDAMPGQYVGRTIEKTPEVSKNLALDTFANKYKDWMQNTASTDVLVIGKDGNYKQEKYVDPKQGFPKRKNVNIKLDSILKSLVDGKIQFNPDLLKATFITLRNDITKFINSLDLADYVTDEDLTYKVQDLKNFNEQIDTYITADEPNFNTIFKQSETPKARAERKQKLFESQLKKRVKMLKEIDYENQFLLGSEKSKIKEYDRINEFEAGMFNGTAEQWSEQWEKNWDKRSKEWEKSWQKQWDEGRGEREISKFQDSFEKSFAKANTDNRILFTILSNFYNRFANDPQFYLNDLKFSISQFVKGKDPFIVGTQGVRLGNVRSDVGTFPRVAYPKDFFKGISLTPSLDYTKTVPVELKTNVEGKVVGETGYNEGGTRLVSEDLGNLNPLYEDKKAIFFAPRSAEIGPELSEGKLIDDETFLKGALNEIITSGDVPGKYANTISMISDYPPALQKLFRRFTDQQSNKIFLKTNPEYLKTYNLTRDKAQKRIQEIKSNLKKEEKNKGKTDFEIDQLAVNKFLKETPASELPSFPNPKSLSSLSTVSEDLNKFFGIEKPQIFKYFKNLSKQDAEKLLKEPFDKIVADMIEKIQKSPTINKSFAKEGVYLNLIDYKNPNNLKLPSGRGFVEIDNDVSFLEKFVEKNNLPLEIIENPKNNVFIPVDTDTGYPYKYFSSFARSEGKHGIHSVAPDDVNKGRTLNGNTKEEVASNIKLALLGEKLRNCIGSQCLVDGINSKLFVLTSKQNKEPYFAIKLTKDGNGVWRTGEGSFLGYRNMGLGESEFLFPPELRDLPSIDKNAEMIRDIIQGLNNFKEKGNRLDLTNIVEQIHLNFPGDDVFNIYKKYPELSPSRKNPNRLYKFKDGGEVRGVGALSDIARNMFKQPQGVVTLSSVARNMFI